MNSLFGRDDVSRTASAGTAAQLGVPRKAALALATASAVLALAYLYGDRTRGLDPGVIRQAATLHLPHRPSPVVVPFDNAAVNACAACAPATGVVHPLNGVQQSAGQSAGSAAPAAAFPASQPRNANAPAETLVDDSGALDPFYARLWALQQHAAPQVVTVLHYGDSPTTADLITGDVRALLQARFGDAGHGFNLAAKPWAWYGHRDVDMSDKGWASAQKDATPVGRMKPSVYGLGGAVFRGGVGAQTTYTLKDAAQTAVIVDSLATADGGTLTVSANDREIATVSTAGNGPVSRSIALPAGTRTVKVAVTAGTVKLFGVDFRRGDNGVLYDSLGLNGATTTVLSRTFDQGAWAAELHAAQPSLIVINYGTNESQFAGLADTLEKELRTAIEKTRAAAPGVPILVMSPMDRGEGSATSGIHTNPLIPRIVAIQQRVAAETHCAFFNTYAAMGGDGTMARWYAAKPRLVTADLIHPTPQGAEFVAQRFTGGLYGGFDRWKRAHNIGVVAVADPVEAAAQHKADVQAKKNATAKSHAGKGTGAATMPARKPGSATTDAPAQVTPLH